MCHVYCWSKFSLVANINFFCFIKVDPTYLKLHSAWFDLKCRVWNVFVCWHRAMPSRASIFRPVQPHRFLWPHRISHNPAKHSERLTRCRNHKTRTYWYKRVEGGKVQKFRWRCLGKTDIPERSAGFLWGLSPPSFLRFAGCCLQVRWET